MEPWIKLYRKFTEWEWYSDVTVKAVFLHLLLTANYKPTKWKGEVIEIGETVFGLKELSGKLGISIQKLRTALDKLESTHAINKQTTNKYTRVKVLNYCNYQGLDYDNQQTNNKQITNEQQTNNKQITTHKEFKNKELINNINNNNACARESENKIYSLYQENIGVPSPIVIQILQDLAINHDAALVELAIYEAVKANARNIKYIEGIFRTWDAEGVRTVEDAKLKIAEHQSRSVKSAEKDKPMPTRTSHQAAKKKNAFQDYDSEMTDFDAEIIRQRVNGKDVTTS